LSKSQNINKLYTVPAHLFFKHLQNSDQFCPYLHMISRLSKSNQFLRLSLGIQHKRDYGMIVVEEFTKR